MAFSLDNFDKLSTAGIEGVRKIFAYTDTDETLATLAASAYFNDVDHFLTIGDSIFMRGSDGVGQYEITAVSPNVTMEAATDPGALSETLADGDVFIGNGSNVATARTLSGDVTNSNTGVVTIANDAVTNAKLAEDTIQYVEVTVSTAELLALATTPKELVAAPGADKFIQFLGAALILDYNSVAYTEAGDNMGIKYENAAGVQVSETVESTGFIDQTADTLSNAIPKKDAIVAASGAVNKALVLDNLGTDFAAGNSPMRVQVTYKVVTANL